MSLWDIELSDLTKGAYAVALWIRKRNRIVAG